MFADIRSLKKVLYRLKRLEDVIAVKLFCIVRNTLWLNAELFCFQM